MNLVLCSDHSPRGLEGVIIGKTIFTCNIEKKKQTSSLETRKPNFIITLFIGVGRKLKRGKGFTFHLASQHATTK
jgi:hypothetical protein